MKKSKGFTLVELIISLIIITAIGLVVVTNFNKLFDNRKTQDYEEYVNKIKSAADFYLSSNTSLLSELNTNRGFIQVDLKDLVDNGLISSDLKNPETGMSVDSNENDEFILVLLDDSGTVKFTYPGEKKGEYLQALNKILDYNSVFECIPEADLDTVNFGLINAEGNLVSNYFKSDPNRITCKTTEIDTSKFGTNVVKYSYITLDGVTKEATRNFIVIDPNAPTISNIQYTPTNWTKNNVTITAAISDNESGIAAYSINLNSCGNFTTTNENQITSIVSENGSYSVCARDVFGNIKEEKVTINNIDKTAPTIANINKSTAAETPSLTISTTITDDASGIVAYAINQSSSTPTTWTNITTVTSKTVSQTVTANGTYYVWAKDAVGNISSKSITISNIDKTGPTIANINKSTTDVTPSLTISTTITDNASGVVAYAINQSSSTPTTWTNITAVSSKTVSQTVTANGTYYVWAKDAVGNINSKSIQITTIATLNTKSFSTGKLSSSTYNGTYNTGVTVKGIKSITVNTGQVTNYSFSGTTILFTLKYGNSYTGTTSSTCYTSATVSYYCKAVELVLCKGNKCCWDTPYSGAGQVHGSAQTKYKCPSGYTLSGSTCSRSCSSSYTYYKYTVNIEYYA